MVTCLSAVNLSRVLHPAQDKAVDVLHLACTGDNGECCLCREAEETRRTVEVCHEGKTARSCRETEKVQ